MQLGSCVAVAVALAGPQLGTLHMPQVGSKKQKIEVKIKMMLLMVVLVSP